jgi:hypothetical protein
MFRRRAALLSCCLALLALWPGLAGCCRKRPVVAARCDSDSTTIAPVTRDGPWESERDCDSEIIRTWQKRTCRDALDEVRKQCNLACKLFNKRDDGEKLTTVECAFDKASKTTATPSCTLTKGEVQKVQAHCMATIVCQCDP